MTIATYEYKGANIRFTSDGYMNATDVKALDGAKSLEDWLRLDTAGDLIETLLAKRGPTGSTDLVDVQVRMLGSPKRKLMHELLITLNIASGNYLIHIVKEDESLETWLHPMLASAFACWFSPHLAVWCDDHMFRLRMLKS
jgi:hypothetical protein